MILRDEYLESFQTACCPWACSTGSSSPGCWPPGGIARDEIQTISARGFEELVDGWIDLIQDVIEDTETKKSELFDPFEHKLV